jgi:hypothetical protein
MKSLRQAMSNFLRPMGIWQACIVTVSEDKGTGIDDSVNICPPRSITKEERSEKKM